MDLVEMYESPILLDKVDKGIGMGICYH
uniref:Uncharacterized protein n=1 Tax=Arundo donax TaxID=35708 RepID=A0A0A8ZTW3_ARUDO